MSRTYRRKNCKPDSWVVNDYERIAYLSRCGRYILYQYIDIPLTGKELKKAVNKYHQDLAKGEGSPPSWFVHDYFTKKFRAKERMEIIRMIQTGDFDDDLFDPFKKGAGWTWW